MQTGENVHRENKHLRHTFYTRMCSDGAVSEGGGTRENNNVRPIESV